MRAWIHTARGEHEEAIRDMERARALARPHGPALLCTILILEAQARLYAGQLDRAAEVLAEARRVGEPVEAVMLMRVATVEGDLAMQSGRPHEALAHYARSLETAQARGDETQVLIDLLGVAIGLAVVGDDEDSLFAAGLAAAQAAEIGGPGASTVAHLLGDQQLRAVEERVGAARAEELKARGCAVAPGVRVARACELARERQPA